MSDDPLDFLNDAVELAPVDGNLILRDLLDVTKVALGPNMPEPSSDEARDILRALLATVDRAMPAELQAQDPRVREARILLQIIA